MKATTIIALGIAFLCVALGIGGCRFLADSQIMVDLRGTPSTVFLSK